MAISTQVADLRVAFKKELERLSARPIEGGPSVAVREGVLLAWIGEGPEAVVDEESLAALARLPDGAGAGAVSEVLA